MQSKKKNKQKTKKLEILVLKNFQQTITQEIFQQKNNNKISNR